jgi:hypothetical protein
LLEALPFLLNLERFLVSRTGLAVIEERCDKFIRIIPNSFKVVTTYFEPL